MLFLSMFLLALTAIVADFIHFRRNRHRHVPRRKALIAWAAATDALPLVSSVINVLSPDNGTGLMYLYMWLFWGWIVTVLPRLAFYVFNFLHLRRTGYAVAAGLTLFFLWGATWGRTSIRVSEVEICSDRIPEAFDGYRFVQISDIHVGTIVRPEHDLARLAECINSLHPDAVFFTGDLVNIRAEELTERFIRGDISRSTEGSGLGLSIAQNLTTLQKGTFEIYLDGDLFKVQIGFSCLDVPQPEIEIQMR